MRRSAWKTKSDSSEDAKYFILFQGEQLSFAGAEILETKTGGRSCLFFYTDSLPHNWDMFVDQWDDRELRENEASEYSLVACHIYKVRVDNLTVSSGLKPEETQRKKSKSAEVVGKKKM